MMTCKLLYVVYSDQARGITVYSEVLGGGGTSLIAETTIFFLNLLEYGKMHMPLRL